MSKTFKVIIIALVIVLAVGTISSSAASINMNLESGNNMSDENVVEDTNTTDTNTLANTTTNTTANTTTTDNNSGTESATVTSVSSLPESELGLSNIINILLIAVGVILIFLAIAILIRLGRK